MAVTLNANRDFDVQQLTDAVQGVFAGKTAFMGSLLATQGAVLVNGEMPAGRGQIGNTITIPYFGTLGSFSALSENVASTPSKLDTTNETATVARAALSFEVSQWAQRPGRADLDPYTESARQILEAATRFMDSAIITEAATTTLVADYYSATVPRYIDWNMIVDAKAKWGDRQYSIVGMVMHSRTEADLRKMVDGLGRPLLVDGMGNDSVTRFCGVPIVVSDLVPLTASSMGTVTETSAITDIVIAGTPLGPWNLVIKCVTTGSETTAVFKFSTDGGNTYSANITAAASLPLIDTAKDSLVGMNGATGLTLTLSGTYTASDSNYWTSTANLKATTLICQRGALSFWYNRELLQLQTDKDILKDNDVAAMHLYYAANLYRRRVNGVLPGVVAMKHNVTNFIG